MEGAVQTLVSNAGQLLSKEYQQLRGVSGEVAELQDDLECMTALLVIQSEAEDGAADRFVQVCMKQLRELAYDAEDCIDLYTLRIKSRPITAGVRAWLKHMFSTLFARRRLASEISALRARAATTISERQARFLGVYRDVLRRHPPLQLPAPMPALLSTPANDDAGRHQMVVGIEEQARDLAERLKVVSVGEEGDRRNAVLSIVGLGGIGKTTLAKEVCRLLEADFPWQAVVSVSKAFQASRHLRPLLKGLLQQLVESKTANDRGVMEEADLGQIDGLDDYELAETLNEVVRDKRYLLVIDDVWTIRAWDAIQSMLRENNNGSRIIVTTRIDIVAKACSPHTSFTGHSIHIMKPLSLEYSKQLLVSRVFDPMRAPYYPEEFEDVVGDVSKKCGGVPLAIFSIASVLKGYTSPGSKAKWETVSKSIGSQMESHPTPEGMKHIVTLSYNHLPHELKRCMMYFSIFPEGYMIRKDRLLNRWLAEGLVPQKHGLTMQEVAESYLDELLSRNMIEESDHLEGLEWKEQTYRVHDLLLEVMVSKSLEANFVSLQGGQYDRMVYNMIRRLSIHGGGGSNGVDSPSNKSKATGLNRQKDHLDVQHVRSLSMFHLRGHKLLNQLGNFTLLRVLDLEDCEGVTNKHVRYACNLYLLRFLSLKGTNVSKVPQQVGNLEHLQTLDLYCTRLFELPGIVTKLEKLEYLDFSNKDNYFDTFWNMPRGINKMKALRILGNACLGNDSQVAREVGELDQLQKLALYLDGRNNTIDDDVLRELALSLCKLPSLRSLSIGHRGGNINFLHHLPTPPRLLQNLWIVGGIDGLPIWIRSLIYLDSFTAIYTTLTDDQLFDVLCMLPNLKSLQVNWKCYRDSAELVARSRYKFPVLKDLTLGGHHLPTFLRFEEGSMAALEALELRLFDSWCVRIIGIEHLTKLKKVTLENVSSPELSNAILEQLKEENDRRSRSSNKQFQIVVKYI